MPKRPLQDIVSKPHPPRQSGSFHSQPIRPSSEVPKRGITEPVRPVDVEPIVYRSDSAGPPKQWRRRHFSWLVALVGILVVIVIAGFALSIMFSGASVTIHPKAQSAYIKGNFIATQEEISGQLKFNLKSLDKIETKEIEATKSEHVEERASGQITVFNNYNTDEQRLITNTRFEADSGKIYRIKGPIVVPGRRQNTDGTFTPGSVDVTVYADEPGESYNVQGTNFKIPGFEGTPRYEGFSAKTKSPISGGFVGDRNTVDEAQLSSIHQELANTLKTELNEAAQSSENKPEGFLAYNNAVFYEFNDLPIENADNKVNVQVKGTIHIVLFNEKVFAQFLAAQAIADYDGGAVMLMNPAELQVTATKLDADEASEVPWEKETLRINIEGTGKFVWLYDEEQLKNDLMGKDKAAFHTILAGYPSIKRAEVEIRPFWQHSFPKKTDTITINKVLD